ncbi:WYL domain-containing protein [Alloalcanivorax xenomutans]|uniref:helix-turn-helix transcriptional regulator n=1 Tax=Alloalcanivorax xenomutans TaxID=1094342 RepID=UPI000E38B3C2
MRPYVGTAREKAAEYYDEEKAVRTALGGSHGALSLRELRARLIETGVFRDASGEQLRKRVERALGRLEDQGVIERVYSSAGKRAVGVKLVNEPRALEDFIDGLKSKGGGRAALAVTLALAKRSLRNQLPARYYQQLEGLFNLADAEVRDISNTWMGPESTSWDTKALIEGILITQKGIKEEPKRPVSEELLDHLYEAIARHKRVHFLYSGKRQPGNHQVECHPLGIVFRGPKTYLVGEKVNGGRQEVRVWSLNRVGDLKVTHYSFTRPESFSLAEYVEAETELESVTQPGEKKVKTIQVCVLPRKVPGLGEATLVDDFREIEVSGMTSMVENQDGSLTVTFRRRDTLEFRRWLRGFGDGVSVIKG